MIIEGRQRGGAKQLADHLLRQDTNEKVILRELTGHPAETLTPDGLREALSHMEAKGLSKGRLRSLYHNFIAVQEGEILTAQQLQRAVDALAQTLGMAGHDRIVVEHHKNGRQHFHVAFSLIVPATGIQAELRFSRSKEYRLARQLEKEFGLQPVLSKGRSSRQWEHQRGKRSGIDPAKVRKEVTAIYRTSTNAKELVANLDKAGYSLSKGKNGSYVLVDSAGDIHGLMRRIEGARLKDLRQKFPDLKDEPLPCLADVVKQRQTSAKKTKVRKSFRRTATVIHAPRPHGRGSTRSQQTKGSPSPFKPIFERPSLGVAASKPIKTPTLKTNPRPTRKAQEPTLGGLAKPPKIKKSLFLIETHAAEWKHLAERYAGKRWFSRLEKDKIKREAWLLQIDHEEEAERRALAEKQRKEVKAEQESQRKNQLKP